MKTTFRFFCSMLAISFFSISCENAPDISDQKTNTIDSTFVNTKQIENISITSAVSGAIISNKYEVEILSKGICWSGNQNPTSDLSTKLVVNDSLNDFTTKITGLKEGQTYYVRAYVTTNKGVIYGNTVKFITELFNQNYIVGSGVNDIDGNFYKTVIYEIPLTVDKGGVTETTIVRKEWMAENLRVTKFATGEAITSGIWGHDSEKNNVLYGKYYNWITATNTKKICPDGWHIPTRAEWTELRTFLDNTETNKNKSGVKMRSTGLIDNSTGPWESSIYSTEGTNESGFEAVPAGVYNFGKKDFSFEIGKLSLFWSATAKTANVTSYTTDVSHYSDKATEQFSDQKQSGLSCRCVKD